MIYPFIPSENFSEVVPLITDALKPFKPFNVSLDEFQFFKHKGSCTMWLNPKTDVIVSSLNHDLISRFIPYKTFKQLSKTFSLTVTINLLKARIKDSLLISLLANGHSYDFFKKTQLIRFSVRSQKSNG
jgi:glycine cleavage system protein P-like pyridoxal-binding family